MTQELNLKLPSAADLFSSQEERDIDNLARVVELPLEDIEDFPKHPFKVQKDAKMIETIESVREHGVLVPCIVRPKADGKYEMIAGHRRKYASLETGRTSIPCLVSDLSDDKATIVMVDSNLQREVILPSEKAFAYQMKLDAMKRQAGRPSKNSVPVAQNFESKTSRALLGEQVGESQDQVRRYIRLTQLVPELLQMVDNGILGTQPQIAMRPAVELSYLPQGIQLGIVAAIALEDATPSHVQALKMRQFAKEGRLSEDVVCSIMQEEKPNQKEKLKLPMEKLSPYFKPNTSPESMMETIVKALQFYRERQRKLQERENR